MSQNTSNYREDFPGYQGFIPYKRSIIGKTVGGTNETIKSLLTAELPKEQYLVPAKSSDFSEYNRDYFCDTFPRDYLLEEDEIYSNKSKNAETWVSGSKYKIYPQHIPGVETYVPGIKSSNIHGMSFSKASAISIKGNYTKKQDSDKDNIYVTTSMDSYKRPRRKILKEENEYDKKMTEGFYNPMDSSSQAFSTGKSVMDFKRDLRKIYKSKIAKVPTVGYTGSSNVFREPVGYLNYDKILEDEKNEGIVRYQLGDELSPAFKESISNPKTKADKVLPYVVGYKGFRAGIKARNYVGENFHDASLKARNEAKMISSTNN
ncbi:MAG: hypothetical protein MJ252_12250 [archaeon]|nr:hypothetical protein [archaeon]